MRRFAEIDETNTVTRVVMSENQSWLVDNLGGAWVETHTDGTRYNHAGIGYTYDEERDAFIPPKPFDSWLLDEATCLWTAPIEYPADGGEYTWDESLGDWVEVVSETT